MAFTGGNAVGMKQMNKTAVLQLLLEKAPLTKAEIASYAELTFATVSNLVSEMQADDLIVELGYAESHGGRKPVLYSLNPNAFAFIGIDLQVEKIVCALTNFEGALVYSEAIPYQVEDGPYKAVQSIRTLVNQVMSETDTLFSKIRGIGVSAPGPIDNQAGIIISPPNMPGWRNVPFRDLLVQEFQIPCYLEKDANAAALGELRYGAGKDVSDLVYIMVDVGIGGGIIIDNHIYRGFLNGAGEIGHMMIDANGPPCNCGCNGCLEAVASGIVIEREARRELGTPVRLEQLLQQGFGRYPFMREHLAKAGQYLGIAVANLCNALNPPLVILGGEVVDESDLYFEQACEKARERILPDFAQRIQIVRAKLGGLSGAIGAATFVFQSTFYQTL